MSYDANAAAPSAPGERSARLFSILRQQPRGLFLVSITEFWERFSYWGMLGLLVLFLTAAPADGGFGWTNADALGLYALYTGAVFSAPALGGYLASRYIGERRCILWGGVSVTAGHLLLAGPTAGPWLIELSTGHAVGTWLHSCGIVLGQLLPATETQLALQSGQCAADHTGRAAVALAYSVQAWTFALGLILIVAGTGFIKATVSSIIGKLYAPDDRRRDEGFAIFMAFVYLGAISSNLVAGTLGELLGWHYGFAAAGLGMASGLTWYLRHHRRVLGTIGERPDHDYARDPDGRDQGLGRIETARVVVAVALSLFVIVYAMSFYQKGGLLNLETKAHVDREVLGFAIPATWLLSISTLVFIVLTLPAARLWRTLAARKREPDVVIKLICGLAALACGYVVFSFGLLDKTAAADGRFSLWWIVAMYSLFAIGDLLVWPAQIAAVSRLAPPRHAAFAIGSWYLTIGIGSWMTGLTGPLAERSGIGAVSLVLIGVCASAAVLLLLLRPRLLRLTHGALEAR